MGTHHSRIQADIPARPAKKLHACLNALTHTIYITPELKIFVMAVERWNGRFKVGQHQQKKNVFLP
ncbi:MAG TPA: hypothetical protein DCQ77_02945 [Betaproteobacteria bacterium]|nr:hypothetical protein [Betaproteobacteria bacterium]